MKRVKLHKWLTHFLSSAFSARMKKARCGEQMTNRRSSVPSGQFVVYCSVGSVTSAQNL